MSKAVSYIILGCLFTACIQTQEADLVVHNATIYTLNEGFAVAQAMAIRDGKIIEVGAEREILNRYKAAEIYDARKMYIYPGFIDAHSHFIGYARLKSEVNLNGAASMDEVLERVALFSKSTERDWITGRGWDQNLWAEKVFPDKDGLDSLFPDRPVLIKRVDGHAAIANSAALRKCAINADTKVAGGKIEIGEDGTPTGLLIDRAIDRVARFIPPLSTQELVPYLIEAQNDCFKAGLTSVSDAGISVAEVRLLDSLHRSGELSLRIYAFLKPNDESLAYMQQGPVTTEKMSVRAVKLYADGALGSRGALLKQPYSDDEGNLGILLTPIEEIEQWARNCIEHGYQLNTHCIGDSANALVLSIYAAQLKKMNDLRWRIEHAQVVSPEDRTLFRNFGIIPSVQPVHATSDGAWAAERLGGQRISHAYAYESLRKTLGILALGTDFPVEDIAPLANYCAAVFRKKIGNEQGVTFQADEALSPQDALRGMTIWAAISAFEESNKGSLEAGKFADFVLLNRDITKVNFSDMSKVKVMDTWLDGERK
jgi:hypothetical protein